MFCTKCGAKVFEEEKGKAFEPCIAERKDYPCKKLPCPYFFLSCKRFKP